MSSSKSQSLFTSWHAQPVLYVIILFTTFLFTACKKNEATNAEEQAKSTRANGANQEFISGNAALPAQTIEELFQVRAATAKYMDTTSAKADHYINTHVELPHMGLHFVNEANLLDGKFDISKPEFLVYNKLANGRFELVAVEYAVPMIDKHDPNEPQPAGFTGDADIWDPNTLDLGFWTLHAWVWKTNPAGVFTMMNPIVP